MSCHSLLDGYWSTVQGLLDWFEVDLGFTELLFIQIDLCILCVFVLYSPVSLSSCPFLDILLCLPRAVGVKHITHKSHCDTRQHTATRCNTLQQTATLICVLCVFYRDQSDLHKRPVYFKRDLYTPKETYKRPFWIYVGLFYRHLLI